MKSSLILLAVCLAVALAKPRLPKRNEQSDYHLDGLFAACKEEGNCDQYEPIIGLVIAKAQDCSDCQMPLQPQDGNIQSYCSAMTAYMECMSACPDTPGFEQVIQQMETQMSTMCRGMSGGGSGGCNPVNCAALLGGQPEDMSLEEKCPIVPKVINCMVKMKDDCAGNQIYTQMMTLANEHKNQCNARAFLGKREALSNFSTQLKRSNDPLRNFPPVIPDGAQMVVDLHDTKIAQGSTATLSCSVVGAGTIRIMCSGFIFGTQDYSDYGGKTDPKTNAKLNWATLELSSHEVQNYRGSDYTCNCYAWTWNTATRNWEIIDGRKARIEVVEK